MNLQNLIKIPDGGHFLYKGEKQEIVWREEIEDIVGQDDKGGDLKLQQFAIFFLPANITFRSMNPFSRNINLSDYEHCKQHGN